MTDALQHHPRQLPSNTSSVHQAHADRWAELSIQSNEVQLVWMIWMSAICSQPIRKKETHASQLIDPQLGRGFSSRWFQFIRKNVTCSTGSTKATIRATRIRPMDLYPSKTKPSGIMRLLSSAKTTNRPRRQCTTVAKKLDRYTTEFQTTLCFSSSRGSGSTRGKAGGHIFSPCRRGLRGVSHYLSHWRAGNPKIRNNNISYTGWGRSLWLSRVFSRAWAYCLHILLWLAV